MEGREVFEELIYLSRELKSNSLETKAQKARIACRENSLKDLYTVRSALVKHLSGVKTEIENRKRERFRGMGFGEFLKFYAGFVLKGVLSVIAPFILTYFVLQGVAYATGLREFDGAAFILNGLNGKDFWLIGAFLALATVSASFAWAFKDALNYRAVIFETYGVLREIVSAINAYEQIIMRLAESQVTALGELELSTGQLVLIERELGAVKQVLEDVRRSLENLNVPGNLSDIELLLREALDKLEKLEKKLELLQRGQEAAENS